MRLLHDHHHDIVLEESSVSPLGIRLKSGRPPGGKGISSSSSSSSSSSVCHHGCSTFTSLQVGGWVAGKWIMVAMVMELTKGGNWWIGDCPL